jgi:redox-sensitive bicupin YhaK (pirin superfamily)
MTTRIIRSHERGSADYGWLKPNYYFSFAQYHNPQWVHFGMLRVLNDDFIAGGGMFPAHPHDNMEIVTIPLSGAVKHQDNTGGQGIIEAGDIQIMSAGSGIVHSEANASATDPLTLFQIWLFPKERNITPRYDQRSFDVNNRINQWQIIVSPLENDNALYIHQNARFALTNLQTGNTLTYQNGFSGNGVFLVVIDGEISLGNEKLSKRDAIGISETDSFTINALTDAQLLAIEVPMR